MEQSIIEELKATRSPAFFKKPGALFGNSNPTRHEPDAATTGFFKRRG
jgi:hypothetical protein